MLTLVDKSNSEKNACPDSFAECLRVVLRFFGVSADIEGLKSQLARDAGALTIAEIDELGVKLNFTTRQTAVDINELKKSPTPVILLMKGEAEPCVYLPKANEQGRVFSPGQGFQAANLQVLAETYSGITLSIRLNQESVESATEHMSEEKPIDWFWKPLFAFLPSFVEVLICSLFINLFVIALPLFTLNVYDSVIPNFAEATLFVLATGIAIALIFDFLLKTMRGYILERVAARVGADFDTVLMDRLMMVNREHMTLSIGERSNLFRELQGVREFYASRFVPTIVDLPFFLLFLLVIYMLSPPLVIVPIVGAIVIFVFNLAVQIPINRSTRDYFSSMQKKSTLMIETLTGVQAIKQFNATGSRLFKWKYAATRAAETTRRNQFLLGAVQNLSVSVMHLVHVFIVVFGVYQIQAGNLSIGGLIACTILSGRAIAPIMNVAAVIGRWKQTRDVLETIDKVFKLPHEGDAANHRSFKGPLKGDIQLENVSFQYPGQMRPAINDISLTIAPGEHVALIGPSGAGKSTLASIIAGQLNDYEGQIYIGNYGQKAISPPELRRSIAVVPQFAFFISGTIRDNLLLGGGDVSDEALHYAARISGLEQVIKQIGSGLDTEVGENGSRLSGGQKQAISIARAILRNPRIMIFDEPTIGLDSNLEQHFKSEMVNYLKGRTLIMVTHRTPLLSLVDRLILLDKGKLIADGPTQTVLKKLGA